MDHGRVRRELVVTVGIVAFIAIAIIKPWGGGSGISPGPSATARPSNGALVTIAPTPLPVPTAGRIVDTIPIAGYPDGPTEAPGGLWYLGGQSDLTLVDTATAESTKITIDETRFPRPISMTADGSDLWLTGSADSSFARLHPATGAIVDRIPVSVAAPYVVDDVFEITRDAGTLWAIGAIHTTEPVPIPSPVGSACCDVLAADVLLRADIKTHQVDDVHQVDGAVAIAAGFGSIWVLEGPDRGEGGFFVVRLDPGTGVPVATMSLPDFDVGPTGCGPCVTGLRIGADGVWTAIRPQGRVIRIDPAQNRIVDEIEVGLNVTDLAVGSDGSVWVVGATAPFGECPPSTGFLTRIDPGRNEVTGIVPVDCPVSVAVSQGDVWVGGYQDRAAVVQRVRPTP
jgi:hypothetical protein